MANLDKDIGEGPEIDPLTDQPRNQGDSPLETELPESGAFRTEDGVVAPDPDAEGGFRDPELPDVEAE